MNFKQAVVRGLLPLLVLGAGFWGAKRLVDTKPIPEKRPRQERGLMVEVTTVTPGNQRVIVVAHGTVVPAYTVDLAAEISGRVTWKNPELTVGGQLVAGDVLVRIDQRDYKLALAQQKAAVAKAQAELELERGRKRVAEEEWKLFGKDETGSPALAQREPQLRSVELGLASAQTSLDQAKLTLDKTVVRAPVNAIVRENYTEAGRLITPQQPVAKLVGSDTFMVEVSLPVEDLRFLSVPGVDKPLLKDEELHELTALGQDVESIRERTAFASVVQQAGEVSIERSGFVTRLLGDLDPVGRMARVLVAIRDPLGKELPAEQNALPLLLGAYVQVTLEGRQLEGVVELPRLALREGDRVYLASADDKLAVRTVQVVRRRRHTVLVSSGIESGDRVILSVMPSAVEGMELRVTEKERDGVEAGKRAELRGAVPPGAEEQGQP